MRQLLCPLLLLAFAGAAQAAPVTIDFDEIAASFPGPTVDSQGFLLDATHSPYPTLIFNDIRGSIGHRVVDGPYRLSASNGSVFDLTSFDALNSNMFSDGIEVTGYFASGGTVITNFIPPADGIYHNFLFSAEWKGLVGVEYRSTGNESYVDNIVVNVVPIPAAVWLFGSAIAGLGWFRRKLL